MTRTEYDLIVLHTDLITFCSSPLLMLFKVMPTQVLLPLRAINALFRDGDKPGRLYLKIFILSLFRIKLTAAKEQIKAIKDMATRKPIKTLSPAMALRLQSNGATETGKLVP